jgi:hypothetical protein
LLPEILPLFLPIPATRGSILTATVSVVVVRRTVRITVIVASIPNRMRPKSTLLPSDHHDRRRTLGHNERIGVMVRIRVCSSRAVVSGAVVVTL